MAVLANKKPDRVPILANMTIQVAEKFAPLLNKEVQFIDSFLATRISHRDILLELGNDAVIIAPTREEPTTMLQNGNSIDEWNLVYQKCGFYGEVVKRPLSGCKTVDDLNKYRIPDPNAPQRWEFAKDSVIKYKNDYAIVGDLEACLFELSWNLVGLEKFLMDMYFNAEYIVPLLDRIEKYSTECGKRMIDIGVDMIWTGDDFGTQTRMMLSPELWRKTFKPRYARMFAEFKRLNPNIKIAYHSCGSIAPIISDYIEIGVDFINPIQPAAVDMELNVLYEKYKDQVGFFGGVDVQEVLPRGNTDDVKLEVRRCMDSVQKSTRYIIAPAHNIQPDTPVENVLAFFDEAKKYGVLTK